MMMFGCDRATGGVIWVRAKFPSPEMAVQLKSFFSETQPLRFVAFYIDGTICEARGKRLANHHICMRHFGEYQVKPRFKT